MTFIPFGVDRWSMQAIQLGDGRALAPHPIADVRDGQLLRLNDDALDLPPPAPTEAESPLRQRVTARLKRLGAPWNNLSSRFIDAYMCALAQHLARHRDELEAKLARFSTLFRPEDFLFSAPLPLPRAFLPTPPGATDADFVPVDFAFWLGTSAVAHILLPHALTPRAARQREQRLTDAGIRIEHHTASDLDAAGLDWLARNLGPCLRFWDGLTLPSAPGPTPLVGLER